MMNIWNRFLQASLGLLLCFAVVQTVYGQSSARVSRYTVATFTWSFNSISSSYSSVGSGDDGVYYAGTLPFAFNFDSTNFASGTSLYIGCNGGMGIGTS